MRWYVTEVCGKYLTRRDATTSKTKAVQSAKRFAKQNNHPVLVENSSRTFKVLIYPTGRIKPI
jgi:hypothetical protein